jgi:hypothetical protein
MSRRARRSSLTLAAVAAAALLSTPAAASASTKSKTIILPGNDTTTAAGTVTAKCPKGQRATGGGFRTAALGSSGGTVRVLMSESRKVGQRSWRVSGFEDFGSPVPLTAFVYCSEDAPKTKAKSQTVNVPDASPPPIVSADASCGGAGQAQAGGFFTPVAYLVPYALIFDSFRAGGKIWRTRAVSVFGTPPLTSYAYCAETSSPKARAASVVTATDGALVTAQSKKCRDGTAIAAGGFSQPNATNGGTPATNGFYAFVWESFRTGKRWQVSAQHGGMLSTTLTSIAYCA